MLSGIGSLTSAATLGVLLGAMTGCASTPVPIEKMAVAKDSVQRAEQAGAPEFAPVELATAREKLARADKAAADRQGPTATALAEQANVDAQVAEAAAIQQKSHKAAQEFDVSMQALRQESLRSTPPVQ